jgi:hypothetical protein
MGMTVVSGLDQVCRHCLGREVCDFRDNNKIGKDSYFDEADMNS